MSFEIGRNRLKFLFALLKVEREKFMKKCLCMLVKVVCIKEGQLLAVHEEPISGLSCGGDIFSRRNLKRFGRVTK